MNGIWPPRLSLAYKTGEHSQFSFAYGQFYQTPEQELMRYQTDFDFEKATHYIFKLPKSKEPPDFSCGGLLQNLSTVSKIQPGATLGKQQPW